MDAAIISAMGVLLAILGVQLALARLALALTVRLHRSISSTVIAVAAMLVFLTTLRL